jgi:hypothetical protein
VSDYLSPVPEPPGLDQGGFELDDQPSKHFREEP